jgi:hypothetical protein
MAVIVTAVTPRVMRNAQTTFTLALSRGRATTVVIPDG